MLIKTCGLLSESQHTDITDGYYLLSSYWDLSNSPSRNSCNGHWGPDQHLSSVSEKIANQCLQSNKPVLYLQPHQSQTFQSLHVYTIISSYPELILHSSKNIISYISFTPIRTVKNFSRLGQGCGRGGRGGGGVVTSDLK